MVKRGKLKEEIGNKGKPLKGSISKGFNKVIKGSKKKKIIIGGVLISVLSLSLVGYFQSKSALASNYKSLKISESPENINSITAYNKIAKDEEINVLFLGDESYLGDVVLKEDVKSFIEDTYGSTVSLTNISEDDASIYEQLNEYINLEDREFDLVFLCFENSDEKEISKTNFSGIYESILRDLKYNNTSVDIVPIIKHNTVVNDTYYQIINGLSKYYDLEMAKVNDNILDNDAEGETIEKFRGTYSTTIIDIIKNNSENQKEINTEYKEVCYGVTTLFEPYKITVKGEKKKGFNASQSKVKSNTENDYIKYKVDGNIVGLGYETSGNGGIIEVYVNRVLYRRIDTKSDIEDLKYILISSNLTGENEIKVVNNNGGDVTLLGVISSGNNTDSKEVENLNNILARNTGNYNGQKKNTSLYENAKVENSEVIVSKKNTTTKSSEDKESTVQSKPSINTEGKASTSSDSVSSNDINTKPSTEIVEEKKPVENTEGSEAIKDTKPMGNSQNNGINNVGIGNTNINGDEGENTSNNTGEGSTTGNNTGSTNSGVNNNANNSINNGVDNSNSGLVDSGNNNIGNNSPSNSGNSNENNNEGESVGNQGQENAINSSAQNSERVNNEGSLGETETTQSQ